MTTKRVSFIRLKNGKVKAKPDKNGRWLIASPPVIEKASGFNMGDCNIGFDPASPVQEI